MRNRRYEQQIKSKAYQFIHLRLKYLAETPWVEYGNLRLCDQKCLHMHTATDFLHLSGGQGGTVLTIDSTIVRLLKANLLQQPGILPYPETAEYTVSSCRLKAHMRLTPA